MSDQRVVVDGKHITAAGVSAGLDMAFDLAGCIAGDSVAQAIQLGHAYDPRPPYRAGSPSTAPREIVEHLRSRRRAIFDRRNSQAGCATLLQDLTAPHCRAPAARP